MMDMLESIPDDEKEHVLSNIFLDPMKKGDFEDDKLDDNEVEDDEVEDHDEDDYPHFLPRPNVQKFTLRVTLRGLEPAIYRKFNVPSNITLRHLSELLLELMGWENEHLNQFRKGDSCYAPAYQREGEMPILFGPARNFDQEGYAFSDHLPEKDKTIEWEYDFGDSWMHDIRLSSIDEYAEGEPHITFIKGKCQCPPEDCGSIWDYAELLELHEKRKARKRLTAEEKDRLEWYGMDGDFDPEYFDNDFAQEVCLAFCE